MRTLAGRQAHFAHLQFHSYGGRPGGDAALAARPSCSSTCAAHPEITADVGQVMFGPAVTMTADGPVSAMLRDLGGDKWLNHDTEVETGCGIVPYRTGPATTFTPCNGGSGSSCSCWASDPWQVMLSTDHPNGGSFLSYPKLIRLLMDRAFREDQMGRANQRAIRRTALLDGLDREYTLNEIAIITRAAPGAPARAARQGPPRDRRRRRRDDLPRPRRPRGDVRHPALRDQGRRGGRRGGRAAPRPTTGCCCRAAPRSIPDVNRVLEPLFGERYTVAFEHYPVRDPALREPARIVEAGGS